MNFYNLVFLINQSIQALDTHPNKQLAPLIDDLARAKAELNRLISSQSFIKEPSDHRKDCLDQLVKNIAEEKESLTSKFNGSFEETQELFRLGIIEAWLYDAIYLLEHPDPSH